MASTKRLHWVDWAKAIGIFFIVWSHCHLPTFLHNYLFSFHVPLFFFISGFLSNEESTRQPFPVYASRHVRRLVVPYVVLGLVAWGIWAGKEGLHPGRNFTPVPLMKPLLGMVYGTAVDVNTLKHAVTLWFIPALFCCHLLHYPCRRAFDSRVGYFLSASLVCLVGFLSWRVLPLRLPWGLENGMVALIFYATGHLLRGYSGAIETLGGVRHAAAIALLGGLQVFAVVLTGPHAVDMRAGDFGNAFVFVIAALAGIGAWILLLKSCPRLWAVEVISRNTLTIFVLQSTFGRVWSTIRFFVFRLPDDSWLETPLGGLAFSVMAVIALSVVGELARRWTPWAVGANRQARTHRSV